MPRREKPLFVFKLAKTSDDGEDAEYSFVIAAKNLRLKSSAGGSVYRLCDIVETFPEVIECSGIQRPVFIVLKVYSRIPQHQLKKQREMRRYESLAKGKWVFSEE